MAWLWIKLKLKEKYIEIQTDIGILYDYRKWMFLFSPMNNTSGLLGPEQWTGCIVSHLGCSLIVCRVGILYRYVVLYCSGVPARHIGPVWDLQWILRNRDGEGTDYSSNEMLMSVSLDGLVKQWAIRQGFECKGLSVLFKSLCLYFCLSACLCLCRSLSVCLSPSLPLCLSLSLILSVCLSLYLCLSLSEVFLQNGSISFCLW